MVKQQSMRLEDACILIADCPHSTAPDEGAGYPLVRTPNIGNGRLVFDKMHRVSRPVYELRNKRAKPQAGDLIYAREAPAGNVALITEGQEVCLGQRTVLLRPNPKIADSAYLTYYLLAPEQKHRLLGTATGATVTHVNIPVIRALEISLPPLPVQRRIADILSAYDDVIENNRRRIAILEETARLAYRKWFVEFQFPGHGRTPTTKEIPHGWERVHLGDCIATNQATYRPSDLPPEINYIDISAVKEGRILEKKRLLSQEAPGRARRKAQTGDVIWSNVRPNLKSYALVVEPEPNDVFSTGFTILTPTRIPYSFLYCLVSTDEFVSYLDNMVTGSTYPAVRPCVFEQAELILPNRELLDDFHGLFAPFLCQCRKLERQNTALAAARDMLLPRLLKGNVERDNA